MVVDSPLGGSWPKNTLPLLFSLLFFPSICWYCGGGVFGLMVCKSLSSSIALPTSFNDNKKMEKDKKTPLLSGTLAVSIRDMAK